LEKLAERNAELVELLEKSGGVGHPTANAMMVEHKVQEAREPVEGRPKSINEESFYIQDPDFPDESLDDPEDEKVFEFETEPQRQIQETRTHDGDLKSQAEKELYQALRRRSSGRKKVGSI